MSRVLTQSSNFTCFAPGQRNGSRHQRKESEKSPRSVKMMCHTLRASGFISMSGFSGLRTVNPLDTTTNTIMQRPTLQYFYYSKVPSSGSGAMRRCSRRCVPNAMFEHFTEKANKVIILAKEESRRLNHNFVGTEQILLGLMGERTGIAAKVLTNMGIKLEDARMKVEKFIGRGSEFVAVDIPFTPRAWRVMELSLEEARQLEHNYIGTEHLLLGLLREEEGVAAHVLKRLGVHDPTKIRTQVIRMVTGKSTDDSVNKMPTLSTNLTKLADEVFRTVTDESTDDSVNKMPTLSPNLTKLVEEVTRMVTSKSTDGSVKKMSTSEEYSTNLTKLAEEGKLDPVVGRQQQIERVTQILLRNTKNNPCLIGLPGVGKTAIVKGLAQRIANGDVPESIKGKKVVTLETGLLVAGTKSRGEFEKRLKKIIEEIKQRDDIILFIDEVHTVIEAGSAEAANDAANILKPALARGELQCIGATTLDEYKKHIEKDPALERRFQPIEVPEPTVDETIQILKGLKEHYETHHELRYTDEALVTAATLSYQYISDRFLPDKAIDLVDEAGSQVRLRHAKGHAQLLKEAREQDEEIRQIVKEKEEAVRNQDFGKAIQLRDRERDSKAQMSALVEKYKEMRRAENEAGGPFVTKADIQHIVSSWTGIPVEKVSTSD